MARHISRYFLHTAHMDQVTISSLTLKFSAEIKKKCTETEIDTIFAILCDTICLVCLWNLKIGDAKQEMAANRVKRGAEEQQEKKRERVERI